MPDLRRRLEDVYDGGFGELRAPELGRPLRQTALRHRATWRALAQRIERPPAVLVGSVRGGRRYGRVDPARFDGCAAPDEQLRATGAAFETTGLSVEAQRLASHLAPDLAVVLSRSVSYDRVFLLVYEEGDFIDPHGDDQTRQRLYVQLPIANDCASSIRVMRAGWMQVFPDRSDVIRLLSPGVMHEVPPVLRAGPDPLRLVVSLRFHVEALT